MWTLKAVFESGVLKFKDLSNNVVLQIDGPNQLLQLMTNMQFCNSTTDNITAHSGGGQANAVALTDGINRVTAGALNDSVKLPASVAGMEITVINAGANSINVFPATGEAINALGANAAFALATTKVATFFCTTAGQWHSQLTA